MFEVPEHVKQEACKKIWEKMVIYMDSNMTEEQQAEISQTISETFDEVVDIVKKGFGF